MVAFGTLAAYAFSVNRKAKREKAAALAAELAKNKISFVGQDASGNWSVKDSGMDFGNGFTASYMKIGDSVQKLDTPVTYEDVYNFNGNPLTENQIIQAGETRGEPIDISTFRKIGQIGSDGKYNYFPFAQKELFPEKEPPVKSSKIFYKSGVAGDDTEYQSFGDAKAAGGNKNTIEKFTQELEDNIIVKQDIAFVDVPKDDIVKSFKLFYRSGVEGDTTEYATYGEAKAAGGTDQTIEKITVKSENDKIVEKDVSFVTVPEEKIKTKPNNVYRVVSKDGQSETIHNTLSSALAAAGPDGVIFQDTQQVNIKDDTVVSIDEGINPIKIDEPPENTSIIYRVGNKQQGDEITNEFTSIDAALDYAEQNNIDNISTISVTTKGDSTKENLESDKTVQEIKKNIEGEAKDTKQTMTRVRGLNGEFYYGSSVADAKENMPPGVQLDPKFEPTEGEVEIRDGKVIPLGKFAKLEGAIEDAEKTLDRSDINQVSVTLIELNSQGQPIPDGKGGKKTITISGKEYDDLVASDSIQGNFIPIQEYRVNVDGKSETIDLSSKSGELLKAIDNAVGANNNTYLKFTGDQNEFLGEFKFDTSTNAGSAGSQIQGFLRNNPSIAILMKNTFQGKTRALDDDNINLINFRDVIIPLLFDEYRNVAQEATSGVIPLSDQVKLDTINYLKETYGPNFFDNIPGLEEEMNIRNKMAEREQVNNILKKLNPNGDKIVSLSEIPINDNNDTIIMPTVIPEKYTDVFKVASAKLVNKLGITNDVASQRLASLIVGERTKDGISKLVYDNNGNIKPAKNQPVFDYLQDLLNKNVEGYDSQLDLLMDMVKVVDEGQQAQVYKGENVGITNQIKEDFAFITRGNVDEGLALIQTLSAGGSNNWKMLAKKRLGPDWKKSPEWDGAMAVSNAALNAKKTINSMISTYFMADGTPIGLNTLQGSFKLHFNDIRAFVPKLVSEIVDVKLTGFGKNDLYMQDFTRAKNLTKEEVGQQYASTISYYTSAVDDPSVKLKYTVGMENAAKQKNKEALDQIIQESQSNDEETRKLAQRKYYKFMIAYQMAAAIQGGTGGRTISDQDVQNILAALNFGEGVLGLTKDYKHELATLEAARDMMDYLYKINNAKLDTSNPGKIFAAFKFQELTEDSDLNGLTLTSETIARFIEEDGSRRMMEKEGSIAGQVEFSKDEIVKAFNLQRTYQGLDEITSYDDILEKYNEAEIIDLVNSLSRS